MKRFLASALTIVITLAAGVAPAAADDDDDDRDDRDDEGEIELLTERTAAVTAGDTAWLALNWTADDGDIRDVAVTLRRNPGAGVEVTYPTNTGTFTGLMNGHFLDEGEIDFTALRVHVPSTYRSRTVRLDLEATYTSGGERESDRFRVTVPVVQYTDGEHIVQHESAPSVAAGSSAWVDVDFTGLAPVVDDVRMTVTGPLDLVYPAYGAATSLHGDDRLEDGETDTARFRIDTADASPGVYELTTEVSYTYGGRTHTRPGTVTVTVTG